MRHSNTARECVAVQRHQLLPATSVQAGNVWSKSHCKSLCRRKLDVANERVRLVGNPRRSACITTSSGRSACFASKTSAGPSMRSTVNGKQRSPASVRAGNCASLSVVVVGSSSAVTTQKAAQALRRASHHVVAQYIVVSTEEDPSLASTVERTGAEFVKAPAGSSRAQMCDLGMSRATGSIVAVRDDVAVGDASWLDTYLAVLPRPEVTLTVPAESLVMDSMVAGGAVRADSAPPYASLDLRAGTSAADSAAAL